MTTALTTAQDREPREVRRTVSEPSGPAPTATSLLDLQRTAGNRAVGRVLARASAEQQFALTHEGQVESTQVFVGGVPQEAPEDVDEFVLWNFLVNRTELRKGHKEKLDPVAARWASELAADPKLRIRVLGYASVTGGAALNEDLARRRAESVRDHLVELGVPEDQIVIDSSGSRLPMDEGSSPESLARNRRVEVSKFFATSLKTSLSDLGPGIDVRIEDLDIDTSAGVQDSTNDKETTFRIGDRPQVVRARVRVVSGDPDLEVGFLQFATADFRHAGYSDADASGEVADFQVPPATAIDYDHCLSDFGACRDVRFAKLPFSQVDTRGQPKRVARPSSQATTITFDTRPEAVFPNQIQISKGRRGVLTAVLWKMQFKILLVARKGEAIVPLDQAEWEFRVAVRMIVGPAPKQLSRSVTAVSEVDGRSGFLATRPVPDVERAMSMPTCTLRTRMMNQLCKPTISPSPGGLGAEFDDLIARGNVPIPPDILAGAAT
jgi:outer membrane protein OmpA-like peptidoglycan-associated protein